MLSSRCCALKPYMATPLANNLVFQFGKDLEEVFSLNNW